MYNAEATDFSNILLDISHFKNGHISVKKTERSCSRIISRVQNCDTKYNNPFIIKKVWWFLVTPEVTEGWK